MLAQDRCATLDPTRAFGEYVRVAGKLVRTQMSVIDPGHEAPMLSLLIGKKPAGRIDGRGCQPQALEFLKKLLHFIIESARFNQSIDHWPERISVLYGFQFRVKQFRRTAEPLDEPAPMVRLVYEDTDIAVPALVSVRHGCGLAVSGALGYLAGDAVTRNHAQEWVGNQDILERYFDVLAGTCDLAVEQRHERTEGGVHRSQMIGDIARSHQRRSAGMAAEIHQTAHGECDDAGRLEVAVRPGLAEPRDRCQHQRRVSRTKDGVTEPAAFEEARRFVLDQHIGVTHQVTKCLPVLIIFDIQNDAAFIGVVSGKR